MSKTSNRAKLECLKVWKEALKTKPKKRKKPEWLKGLHDEDED